MAIVYSEQFETKKATTNVAGTGANYRIEYIVRNPVGAAINSITATISQVATEGEGETQTRSSPVWAMHVWMSPITVHTSPSSVMRK